MNPRDSDLCGVIGEEEDGAEVGVAWVEDLVAGKAVIPGCLSDVVQGVWFYVGGLTMLGRCRLRFRCHKFGSSHRPIPRRRLISDSRSRNYYRGS